MSISFCLSNTAAVPAVSTRGQTAHRMLINHPKRAHKLKRRAEKLNNLFHGQSVLSRLDSYNFGAGLDFDYTTGSIVCTIAAKIMRTMIQPNPQTAQLSGQLQNSLSGQKNTIPNGHDRLKDS